MRDFEAFTDGQTVWVNADDGMCIGRFSRRGVDIHNDVEGQLETGKQCLDCVHDLPAPAAWVRFVASMKTHWGIEIDPELRPAYATPEAA